MQVKSAQILKTFMVFSDSSVRANSFSQEIANLLNCIKFLNCCSLRNNSACSQGDML